MERNTLTEIKNLIPGDRFYMPKDRNKTVHTKIERGPLTTKYYTYTQWSKADTSLHPEKHKDNTIVHFLRHKATLATLCSTAGHEMTECGEAELHRINQPEVRAKIQAKQGTKQLFGVTPN
jgi:hypothetical protein